MGHLVSEKKFKLVNNCTYKLHNFIIIFAGRQYDR
jgi:hypothetical protein